MVSICGVPVPVLLYIVGPTPRWRLVVCWLSWSMMAPLRPRRHSVSDVIEGYAAAAAAAAPAHNKHYSNPPRPANNTSITVRNRENGNVLEDSQWCILGSADDDDNLLLDIPHTVC